MKRETLDKAVNVAVSVGAAIVIFGAWAKIEHKSYASIMLTIGMLTEAAIFLMYALIPPKAESPVLPATVETQVLQQNSYMDTQKVEKELNRLNEKLDKIFRN